MAKRIGHEAKCKENAMAVSKTKDSELAIDVKRRKTIE